MDAVALLSSKWSAVSEQDLVSKLGLVKSTIHYRVQRATKGGFLVNQTTQRGAPAQLILGAPIPGGCSLPTLERLSVCVENPENDSNPRTVPHDSTTTQLRDDSSNEVRKGFEPGSDSGSNVSQSYSDTGFEPFEPFPGDSAHTKTQDAGLQGELPWDSFLEEVDEDAPSAS